MGDATGAAWALGATSTAFEALRRRCKIRLEDDGSVKVVVTVFEASKRTRACEETCGGVASRGAQHVASPGRKL